MATEVIGREAEIDAVDAFLTRLPNGPACLVVEGDAGIGKTTIWREAVRRAAEQGVAVLASRASFAETRLSFSGLGDLLEAVPDAVVAGLAPPQRAAIEVALLRTEPGDAPPGQRAIGAALLAILTTLVEARPLLLAVDDAQWLDGPTSAVLEFAIRRLGAQPVGILVAIRTPAAAADVFARAVEEQRREILRVGPLSLGGLHYLIKSRLGRVFTRPTLVRIERAARGNPFHALELARELDRVGEPSAGGGLPVPESLRALVRDRIGRLPVETRRALLIAAAGSTPDAGGVDEAVLRPAEEADIVAFDRHGRLEFTHPLFPAAVYGSASAAARGRAHVELAARAATVEERARHLALSSEGPDAAVADSLSAAALAARRRGAIDASVELSELAVRRTPPDRRVERLDRMLELAIYAYRAGEFSRAEQVLSELIAEAPPGRTRAWGYLWLASLAETTRGAEAATDLCELALPDAGDDVSLRSTVHEHASRLADHDVPLKLAHAKAALELAEHPSADASCLATALLALAEAEFYAGNGIREDLFSRAEEAEVAAGRREPNEASKPSQLLAILLVFADELDRARNLLEAEYAYALASGDEARPARILGRLATIELRAGDWAAARVHLRELESVVERTGQEAAEATRLNLQARLDVLEGRMAEGRAAAAVALERATDAGSPLRLAESLATIGFVELCDGKLEAARVELDRAQSIVDEMGLAEPSIFRHDADRIEVLIRLGHLDAAAAALAVLEERGGAPGAVWARATAARCRGLLHAAHGDLEAARASLEEAVVRHAELDNPFELGRTLLGLGQVLRRLKQRRDSRHALGDALQIFDRLGAPAWSARTRESLDRTHMREAPLELTPSERQVAELAASGLTNRLIAEALFVSPKTVEANLARAYRKLGIRTRAELGATMATVPRPSDR